jgi:hypothetical protein
MKALVIVGIVLVALGAAALAYQGITYVTHDTVVDVGPVHVEAARQHTIPLPPIIGGVMLATGIVVTFIGLRKAA